MPLFDTDPIREIRDALRALAELFYRRTNLEGLLRDQSTAAATTKPPHGKRFFDLKTVSPAEHPNAPATVDRSLLF